MSLFTVFSSSALWRLTGDAKEEKEEEVVGDKRRRKGNRWKGIELLRRGFDGMRRSRSGETRRRRKKMKGWNGRS